MTINYAEQAAVKQATARVRCGDSCGTGYLIDARRVVTSHAVVATGAPIECTFGDGRERRAATVLAELSEVEADVAVLELSLSITVQPLELLDRVPPAELWIHGFPGSSKGPSISFDADLIDPDTLMPNGGRAFAVFSPQLASASASLLGLAGSPVLVGRAVVGHVAGRGDLGELLRFGQTYAIHSATVRRLLGQPTQIALASSEQLSTEAGARVFDELNAATTAAEVAAALERSKPVTDETKLFAGKRLVELALPTDAIRILEQLPETLERDQHLAVAHSLRKEHPSAQARLVQSHDPESLGILGGVYKRRWLETRSTRWLTAALDAYTAGYAINKNPYPGINAAFCLLALGRGSESLQLATEIRLALQDRQRTAWEDASYAEALLLCKEVDAARDAYKMAAARHRANPRSVAIIRRQARAVLGMLGRAEDLLDALFSVPRAAAFTGHRVDSAESPGRFPREHEAAVASAIADALSRYDVQYGFSSAASGSDILFIEALIRRQGEPNVFLPFPSDAFIETSVSRTWEGRYKNALDRAGGRLVTIHDAAPPDEPGRDRAYADCNEAIGAAARESASLLDEPPIMIAVVARSDQGALGGARDAVERWRNRGGVVIEIDPSVPEARIGMRPSAARTVPTFVTVTCDAKATYAVTITPFVAGPITQRHESTLPPEVEELLSQPLLNVDTPGVKALEDGLRHALLPDTLATQLAATIGHPIRVQHDAASAAIPFELLFSARRSHETEHPFALHEGVSRTMLASTPPATRRRQLVRTPRVLLVVDPRGNLPRSVEEAGYLQRDLPLRGCELVEPLVGKRATIAALTNLLPTVDILHYSGHATAAGLRLADGTFSAASLPSGPEGPILVVLNGCETAVTGNQLADAFLQSGVHCFVGTGWRIPDETAARFGRRFLRTVLDGTPIGAALAKTIHAIRYEDFSTLHWFYYRLFGDPELVFSGNSSVSPSVALP